MPLLRMWEISYTCRPDGYIPARIHIDRAKQGRRQTAAISLGRFGGSFQPK